MNAGTHLPLARTLCRSSLSTTIAVALLLFAGTAHANQSLARHTYDSGDGVVAAGHKQSEATVASCWDCGPCSPWQAWAGAMFLTRSSSRERTLVYDPPKEGGVFDAREMDFNTAWGPAVGVSYALNCANRLGVEFFGMDGWSSTAQVAGNISVEFPSLIFLPELTQTGAPESGYGVASFDYSSRLFSLEVNLYHQSSRFCWLTTLAGFRWLEVAEDFQTTFVTGNVSPNYAIRTGNQLYGFQLGALALLQNVGMWRFDGWAKAGIYANASRQTTTEDFTSSGGWVTYVAASDSTAAFVGELGLAAKRPITDRLSLRLSYMTLWIEGIALAPEQLGSSDPSSGIAGLNNSGGAFYHGGFLGCEYQW